MCRRKLTYTPSIEHWTFPRMLTRSSVRPTTNATMLGHHHRDRGGASLLMTATKVRNRIRRLVFHATRRVDATAHPISVKREKTTGYSGDGARFSAFHDISDMTWRGTGAYQTPHWCSTSMTDMQFPKATHCISVDQGQQLSGRSRTAASPGRKDLRCICGGYFQCDDGVVLTPRSWHCSTWEGIAQG